LLTLARSICERFQPQSLSRLPVYKCVDTLTAETTAMIINSKN
jgi:hypothetical protein